MTSDAGNKRVDSASRIVAAPPSAVYRAFVVPEALAEWLPPKGMTGKVHTFEPREGGTYRMTLTYEDSGSVATGKSTDNTDVVEGRFLELVPNERIVQSALFESDDPAFAGTMTITWRLKAVPAGTEVTVLCENVPEGIRPEDHDAGLTSTLENLAAFVE